MPSTLDYIQGLDGTYSRQFVLRVTAEWIRMKNSMRFQVHPDLLMNTTTNAPHPTSKPKHLYHRLAVVLGAFVLIYFCLAYLLAPLLWERYAARHPAWENVPRITYTSDKHPGDPLNIAMVGSEFEIKKTLLAAGWYPADPVTLKSSMEIAEASILDRKYDEAPVSSLFLFDRKQDLAFEQPVGDNPRKRHHVRFWKSPESMPDGRDVWFGAATYDERVGLSHTTGEITHHIDGNVDAERDHIIQTLRATNLLLEVRIVAGFHTILEGKNGGGDPWHTDGNLSVAVTNSTSQPATAK